MIKERTKARNTHFERGLTTADSTKCENDDNRIVWINLG